MKSKLIKYALAAFFAMLPVPFILNESLLIGGGYIVIAIMICGATWGQLNRVETNEK